MNHLEIRIVIAAALCIAAIILALVYRARLQVAGGGNLITVISALAVSSGILIVPMLPRLVERYL